MSKSGIQRAIQAVFDSAMKLGHQKLEDSSPGYLQGFGDGILAVAEVLGVKINPPQPPPETTQTS